MFAVRLRSLRDGETLVRVLGPVGWVVIVGGGLSAFFAAPADSSEVDQPVLVVTLALFFTILMIRIVTGAVIWPSRRLALIALAIGILLWAVGSAILNAAVPASATTFPAPGELFFLASYLGLAAFVVLDATSRSSRAETAWLDRSEEHRLNSSHSRASRMPSSA